jgi:hypothetical protein
LKPFIFYHPTVLAGGFADVAATWQRAHMSASSLSLSSPLLYLTLSLKGNRGGWIGGGTSRRHCPRQSLSSEAGGVGPRRSSSAALLLPARRRRIRKRPSLLQEHHQPTSPTYSGCSGSTPTRCSTTARREPSRGHW